MIDVYIHNRIHRCIRIQCNLFNVRMQKFDATNIKMKGHISQDHINQFIHGCDFQKNTILEIYISLIVTFS